MSKKAIALILSLLLTAFLISLAAYLFSTTAFEREKTKVFLVASNRAFWAAEAGAAKAIAKWKTTANPEVPTPTSDTDFDGNGDLGYSVQVNHDGLPQCSDTPPTTNRWRIMSTGSWGQINRTVEVVAEKPCPVIIDCNEGSLLNAVESTGTLEIKGSVDINPDDSQLSGSELSFDEVFGKPETMTSEEFKALLKSLADHTYTNPSENQQPVNGITWVDVTGTNKYHISSNWSGSGILIVNGNGENIALDISGGWTFNGVIWVIGQLSISGTTDITGVIFAESHVDIDNKLTGNATLNFNTSHRDTSFNLITTKSSQQTVIEEPTFVSWEEQ
jgi:hypothetical protein